MRSVAEEQAAGGPSPATRAEGAGWHSDAEITGVMIATPAYGGNVNTRHKMAALATDRLLCERLCDERGQMVPIIWADVESESFIPRARDIQAARFLAHPVKLSHLITIDSDIEWKAEHLLRLIAHDVDVIFGIYPKKAEELEFAFHPRYDEHGNVRRNPVTGAIEIERGSTGFMCIKRRVFEEMAAAYPRFKYRVAGLELEVNKQLYNFYHAYLDDGPEVWDEELGGVLWTEDYGFCNLWRRLGGQVWCDPEITLNHVGTKVYTGNLLGMLASVGHELPAGAERVCGWLVPLGDPWFVPALRATAGKPDQALIDEALGYVADFTLAVDVGAHIGTWAKPLAARFERVVALEPNPAIKPLLVSNINGCKNVEIVQAAAWDIPAVLRGRREGYNSGEFAVGEEGVDGGDEDGALVAGICLDGLDLEQVGLIKVDAEGADLKALQGAQRMLKQWRPVVVVEEDERRVVSSWLAELGMREATRHPIAPGHPKSNVVLVWS